MHRRRKMQEGMTLDPSVMTDDELLKELAGFYGTLLSRLYTHLLVGTGRDGDVPAPQALEAGIALLGRIERLDKDFRTGVYGERVNHSLTGWNWGLSDFETKLKEAGAAVTLGVEYVDGDLDEEDDDDA